MCSSWSVSFLVSFFSEFATKKISRFLYLMFIKSILLKHLLNVYMYLNDHLNIDYSYFEGIVYQIYQFERLSIISDLHISTVFISFVSFKIGAKTALAIALVPFFDGDVSHQTSFGLYILQLNRFARICSHVTDFSARNKCFPT